MSIIQDSKAKIFLTKQKLILVDELKRLENQQNLSKKFPDYGYSDEDNIQELEDFQERVSLKSSIKVLTKDTKEAIKRIDAGKYGICASCKNQIEVGRLKVYPAAILCASCANKIKR